MRSLLLVVAACVLAPVAGCKWLDDLRAGGTKTPPKGGGPLPVVSAGDLVGYLNNQSGRLQTLAYGDVTLTAREGDGIRGAIKEMTYPALRGRLAASQPRSFRMVVDGALAAKVDLGSNPDQFWVSAHIPSQQPVFVYASHSDFESGKAKLPPGITFEPDWVMQAIGMTTFPPNLPYTVRPDEKTRTYVLSWPATTPAGVPIRKEVVFAADDADAGHDEPQVRKHLIRDAKGNLLASATVRSAKTFPVGGSDPTSKRPYVVQAPTHVVLRWEEQKFEMTLKLEGPRVNQPFNGEETRRLFTLPTVPGVSAVNLAEARFDGK